MTPELKSHGASIRLTQSANKGKSMYPIRVEWLPAIEGGRKSIVGKGIYYPTARFSGDSEWPNVGWSVVLDIDEPYQHDEKNISMGVVKFLVKNATEEKIKINNQFEIYEGLKKVADVYLLPSF